MQQRHWFATTLSVGFLLLAPAMGFAQDAPATDQPPAQDQQPARRAPRLPQACVDAGVTTMEDCKALLDKQKADAAANGAAREKAAADSAAADKAAADKAAADKAAADSGAENAPQNAAPAAEKPRAAPAPRLPRACVQAGATTKEDCDALIAQQRDEKAAQDKAAQDQATQDKSARAAREKAAADKAAADAAAADKAAADKTAADKAAQETAPAPAVTPPPTAEARPAPGGNKPTARLPKDCRQAGIATQEECDAFHAIAAQKGKPSPVGDGGQPAVTAPSPSEGQPAAGAEAAPGSTKPNSNRPAAEPAQPAELPAEVSPPKPGRQPAEPVTTTSTTPDIEAPLTGAAKAYNRAVGGLAKGNDDKTRADIKAQQDKIDALCKQGQFDSTAQCLAQYGIQLAPLPQGSQAEGVKPIVTTPAQPVEVIDNLPKGVSKQDIAPLLDSAKDADTGKAPAGQAQQPPVPPAANVPPPSNDKSAQAGLKPGKIVPIDQQQGQKIDAAGGAPKIDLPQNVTVINQTTINNTTVSNTTTNVQNNNGPGMQQNNGQPGQQTADGRPGRPSDNRPGDNRPGRPGAPGQGPGDHGGPGGNDEANPIGLGIQMVLQLGNQLIINSPGLDQRRIANRPDDRTSYEKLGGDRYRETIYRPDGIRIVTIYNRNGDILRRSRFDRSGHEYVLAYFDDRYDSDLANWRDPGEDLPPLRLHIPARDYVLDADGADESDVQRFFAQPPVEHVQRLYSIDEVKRSARIRDMVRRLEIGDLTFDTGAATISEDQVGNLSKVAQAMLALLKKNPAETFLIEGHTDAVGSEIANLKLSDARAATVAQILTDFYHIPPENLATQGYGERFLKVQTDGPERLNRRVTIRRITPLVTVATQNY